MYIRSVFKIQTQCNLSLENSEDMKQDSKKRGHSAYLVWSTALHFEYIKYIIKNLHCKHKIASSFAAV